MFRRGNSTRIYKNETDCEKWNFPFKQMLDMSTKASWTWRLIWKNQKGDCRVWRRIVVEIRSLLNRLIRYPFFMPKKTSLWFYFSSFYRNLSVRNFAGTTCPINKGCRGLQLSEKMKDLESGNGPFLSHTKIFSDFFCRE